MSTTTERPRERLWRTGTSTLGDEDLIAMILGTGVRRHSARAVAMELVRNTGNLAALSRSTPRELVQVLGIGEARAARIAAAFELGRRAVEMVYRRDLVAHPEDVFRLVGPRLSGLTQEVFIVIGVDIRNGLLDITEVARGTVSGVEVHPREVFRPLIRTSAAGCVLVHNHPSGDPTPSWEDIALTRRLRNIGVLMGIPVIDHVVVGGHTYRSIVEWMGTDLEAPSVPMVD